MLFILYCLEKTKCDPNENSGQENVDSLAIDDEENKTVDSQRNTNNKKKITHEYYIIY